APHYIRAFDAIDSSRRFRLVFNWSATLLGPIWLSARRLWLLFWLATILEAFAVTVIATSVWSDLGADQLGRAERLRQTIEQRQQEADAAQAKGLPEASQLQALVTALQTAAENAESAGRAAAAQKWTLLSFGIAVLLAGRIGLGLLANRAFYRSFISWRAN